MDGERAGRIVDVLQREGYRGLVCRLPENVVMLSGYLPVLGNSFCVVSLTDAGAVECRLAVPADEEDLVPAGAAVEVLTFSEETLQRIGTTLDAARAPLGELLRAAGLSTEGAGSGAVGYEGGRAPVAAAYTQVGIPGPATLDLYRALLPAAEWRDATAVLGEIGAVKTPAELARIRRAVAVAQQGFLGARSAVRVGMTATDVAAAALHALAQAGYQDTTTGRVLPYVHVMAGARAAAAYRAFNLTTNHIIERGDTVLVQLEVGIDGYWAELTRTFFAGDVDDAWARANAACVEAQDAALAVIRDGATGREADAAARGVMERHGFGPCFKHGLGHGVGFQAINHGAAPILHPASEAVLRRGMVHNMEPAVYVEGKGGLRLNDDVAVTADGAEVLSAGLSRDLDWLVVPS